MKAVRFRVQNFRNIDDSGWVELDRVTAFVGRNESGKTSLLKALHKFNPATPELYDPLREFPRDRYTRYASAGREECPVCSVEFELLEDIRQDIASLLQNDAELPAKVIAERFYDGSLRFAYEPPVRQDPIAVAPVLDALNGLAEEARRLALPEGTEALRADLANWSREWREKIKDVEDLRGTPLLRELQNEVETKAGPEFADLIGNFQKKIEPISAEANKESVLAQIDQAVKDRLPVLIYFENYGVLDSAIRLSRFIEDLRQTPHDPRVRTTNAMFRHVSLDPQVIVDLGNMSEDPEDIRRKDERAVRLNSASTDISSKFSNWWSQRRHKIRYHADEDYFRIWVADDRRPDIEIELEARSKGFQWFFSFYLVFLVESGDGHKDAILLLDEPGLHLHPTAQQELIKFFEDLSIRNQIIYTTHSPFLVDGDNLHRVRPVTEDGTGHSQITAETWPADRETIFPLQAAAGYAMFRSLFHHRNNVLVEGMTDYHYLIALSKQCEKNGLTSLRDDIYIVPCGGTKYVGQIASLFLGEGVRPVILLDSDTAGKDRRNALISDLYTGFSSNIIMIADALDDESNVDIEDVLDTEMFLDGVNTALGLQLELDDNLDASLPQRVKDAAKRTGVDLPKGWKSSVALHLVSGWDREEIMLPSDVLETASRLFQALNGSFGSPE